MQETKWDKKAVEELFALPLLQLIYRAQTVHRQHFNPDEIELCSLLNIKTGACPEDCKYCSQSGHYKTGLQKEKLWELEEVIKKAKQAKAGGAKRFCMGAAWREPPEKDFPKVLAMIKAVKEIGLETCVTLGKLTEAHAEALKAAGLDFYNHNLDTSREYYPKIITTRTYDDRLETLEKIQKAQLRTCCGGIFGLGESQEDRISFLLQLVALPETPESVPINVLEPIKGTPLANQPKLENIELLRVVAIARILLPRAVIRLSSGRQHMSEEMLMLCFLAGANSMWIGEKLLTAKNSDLEKDLNFLQRLNIKPKALPGESTLC